MKRMLLLGLLAAVPAHAAVYEVDARSGFAAPFGFDFSAFGSPGQGVSTQDSRTVNGVTVTARTSGGSFNLVGEGTSYTGDFARGTTLLAQPNLSDNFILSFSGTPVYGVGTQFEPFSAGFTGSYLEILDVYDASGRQIADFTRSGTKAAAEDNSVPFLGALSTDVPISTIILSVATNRAPFFTAGDVVANGLTLSTTPTQVPEPASLLVLAAGVAFMGLARRRAGSRPRVDGRSRTERVGGNGHWFRCKPRCRAGER